MHVLMYCDTGADIGLGHLMRTLTLCEESVAQGWEVDIAGHLDDRTKALIASHGVSVSVHDLKRNRKSAEFRGLAAQLQPSVIHLDSYETWLDDFSSEWRGIVSNMQDGRFGVRDSTVAIDANYGAEHTTEAPAGQSAHLLGVPWTLVRKQVKAAREAIPARNQVPKILIVLGGSDSSGSTVNVVRALREVTRAVGITVIAPASQHQELHELLEPIIGPTSVLDFADDLPGLAVQHDLVISATGTSVWDFAFLGVPMALVTVADNQVAGYEALISQELAIGLGNARTLSRGVIEDQLAPLLTSPSRLEALRASGQQLIDGLGSWRIVSSWEQINNIPARTERSQQGTVSARKVARHDARMLFDWRNDPVTRMASRTGSELDWDSHLTWFRHTLESPDRLLLVIEANDSAPVGTVRWDRAVENAWEVSITLAPSRRGQGLAAQVLDAGEEFLRTAAPVHAIAVVHRDNEASRRLFARAGYLPYLPANQEGFAEYRKRIWPLP